MPKMLAQTRTMRQPVGTTTASVIATVRERPGASGPQTIEVGVMRVRTKTYRRRPTREANPGPSALDCSLLPAMRFAKRASCLRSRCADAPGRLPRGRPRETGAAGRHDCRMTSASRGRAAEEFLDRLQMLSRLTEVRVEPEGAREVGLRRR